MNILIGFCIFLAVYSIAITGLYILAGKGVKEMPEWVKERGWSGEYFLLWR